MIRAQSCEICCRPRCVSEIERGSGLCRECAAETAHDTDTERAMRRRNAVLEALKNASALKRQD